MCTLFCYKETSKTSNDNTKYNADVDHEIQIQKLNKEIDQLLNLTFFMQSQLTITCECLQEEIKKRTAVESGKKELLKQLHETKKERNILQAKLSSCIEKMSHFSTCNINKQLKTQKANVQNFKNKVLEQEVNTAEFQIEKDNLFEKFEKALKVGLKLRKKKNFFKVNLPSKIHLQKFFCSLILTS